MGSRATWSEASVGSAASLGSEAKVMSEFDVIVIGAGMAGLLAARDLAAAGRRVRIVDKGRGVGGRLATRRIGGATFDHGAQYLAARTPRFAEQLSQWQHAGLLLPWGETVEPGGVVRWRALPSITAVAKHLAAPLDVVTGARVTRLRAEPRGWLVECDTDLVLRGAAVLLTAPVPQALELLDASAIAAGASRSELETLAYDPCLVALAVHEGPSRIPAPGFAEPGDARLAWIADNRQKGVSAEPALTLHGSPEFSRLHWDVPRETSAQLLAEAAADWLGVPVRSLQGHGWRYARPTRIATQPVAVVSEDPPLLLAGDAFAGADAEGAATSGWAAAAALLDRT